MTRWLVGLLLLAIGAGCGAEAPGAPPPSRDPPPGSRRYGVFEGKVPCADCERVKVRLTLHRSTQDDSPTAYVLERIEVGHGNDRLITEGTWSTSVGSPVSSCSTIVGLAGGPADFTRYMAVGSNLLLMLDNNLEPRVGNDVHSFTLSRTE